MDTHDIDAMHQLCQLKETQQDKYEAIVPDIFGVFSYGRGFCLLRVVLLPNGDEYTAFASISTIDDGVLSIHDSKPRSLDKARARLATIKYQFDEWLSYISHHTSEEIMDTFHKQGFSCYCG